MIDIKLLRNDPDTVVANLARRGFPFDSSWYREQEGRRKAIQIRLEDLRSQRNEGSKTVGKIKSGGGSPADLAAQMERLTQINRELEVAEQGFRRIEEELEAFHLTLPNLIDDSVPDGANATQNIEIRRAGTLPQFNFQARDHVAIGEQLACMSFAEASR
ncbi:seryl-tRNA synthetase, partial [mine drainage metagenome]